MSNARYIEIDSTYRNRKEWPNPAEFEILISQSGRKDRLQAQDPVSTAAPLTSSWVGNKFNVGPGSGSSITATVNSSTGVGAAGDNKSTLILTCIAPNVFQENENYYVGAVATNTTNNSSSRILSYKWLCANTAQITLEGSITILMPLSTNTIQITDPSDITTDLQNSYVFVPNGRIGFNAYPNYILWNETRQNYSPILSYDTNTKLVKVKINGLSWSLTDTFSIRKEAPLFGQLNNELGYPDSTIFSLPSAYALSDYDAYRNSYIKVGNEIGLITRYVTLTGNALGGDGTHIILPDNASNINGFYNNMYIQINSEVKKIISYTVTGIGTSIVRTAEFATFIGPPNYYVLAGDPFALRNGFVDNAFTAQFTNGANYEILPFSYDNHNPFVYTGSITSQQEISCYQIELMDLILPNKILNCGFGNRIAFYPYLYVEVTNISGSSSGMKNSIYSNNPNATSAVFRVPIYDVQNPIASAFVKLDGDGMTQTLKFKPNDNIFFSVRLPNGELFKTLEQDRYSPQQPNTDIQISALFSFKRL